jgi:2-polyprenyl-6-methoxyphenol hydroxylase-like FAD-dependent oxidoreductase
MRVVVSGGGIAGLTLAAKLRQQGRDPIVVERAESYDEVGYAIGLWPLGSCVLHGLGCYDELVAHSSVPEIYEFGDHQGGILQRVPLGAVTVEVGAPIMQVARPDLLGILAKACHDVDLRMGTTITDVEERGDVVAVCLSSGDTLEADLLVLADGQHSATREQVFGPVETFDTHWVIWTWWGADGRLPDTTLREYWGPGRLFGMYPCPGRTAVGAGFPVGHIAPDAPADTIRSKIREANADLFEADEIAAAFVDDAKEIYGWPMTDLRVSSWSKGRIALCGDAGVTFLPTAGVGASNALRGAAALADELSRADAHSVELALELYEKRCRHIIEANQHDSRSLARYMFVENRALSWARDQMLRHYPPTKMVDQIVESMRTPF